MKNTIFMLFLVLSVNLYSNERIFIDMKQTVVTADVSKISFTPKFFENGSFELVYRNSNSVYPVSMGEAKQMKILTKDQSNSYMLSDKILYKNLYDNIDMTFYKKGISCKYDFIVYPSGDPSQIVIDMSDNITVEENFLTYGQNGFIKELTPVTYQIINGKKVSVECRAEVNNRTLTFKIGEYNKSYPLIIDPELNFSSILGGGSSDYGGHLAKDSEGNIYHAFQTESNFLLDYDALNNKSNGSRSICVMKYDKDMELLWGMYIGNQGTNHIIDIKCDNNNNVWIGGETNSSNYPTTSDAIQNYVKGYYDMILTKISPEGDLMYSTLYGGYSYDVIAEIDIDSKNNVWATGRSSGGFSSTTGGASYSGDYDGFIIGVSEQGKLLHSGFIGTSNSDIAEGIAIDSKDNIYVSGHTLSRNFQVNGQFSEKYFGGQDAFLVKYSPQLDRLWFTYFGGSGSDWGSNLEIDAQDNVYMSGYTNSFTLPNKISSIQNGNAGGMDMYLAKFDVEGKNIWSTFYGGSNNEGRTTTDDMFGGLDIFDNGDVVIGGRTLSSDVMMYGDGFHVFNGSQDGIILRVNQMGNPIWSTYVGGQGYEENIDVLFDINGAIVCSGNTKSSDFQVTDNTEYKSFSVATDAYIVRFGNACHQSAFELWECSSSDLSLNGSAEFAGDTLTMHDALSYQKGSAWYHERLPVLEGFTTEFKFRIINNEHINNYMSTDHSSAGGLAFVIQNNSLSALGSTDYGLGYDGIPNGIAIEFDNYKNDENTAAVMSDPSSGHISIMGMNNNLLSSDHDVQKTFANVEIKNDSTIYKCRIVYKGSNQKMKIYFGEENSSLEELISLNIDLSYSLDLKDDAFSFLGFTAANGSKHFGHEIFDWTVCPNSNNPETSVDDFSVNKSNLFVFPNPAIDNITLHYSPEKESYVDMNIYDLEGKKVAHLYSGLDQAGEQTISMPMPKEIKTGVYIIEVDYGYTRQLVKLMVK